MHPCQKVLPQIGLTVRLCLAWCTERTAQSGMNTSSRVSANHMYSCFPFAHITQHLGLAKHNLEVGMPWDRASTTCIVIPTGTSTATSLAGWLCLCTQDTVVYSPSYTEVPVCTNDQLWATPNKQQSDADPRKAVASRTACSFVVLLRCVMLSNTTTVSWEDRI